MKPIVKYMLPLCVMAVVAAPSTAAASSENAVDTESLKTLLQHKNYYQHIQNQVCDKEFWEQILQGQKPGCDVNKPQPPVEEEKPPVEEETPPADQEKPPAEEEKPPVEEEKPSENGQLSAYEKQVAQIANEERAKNGLSALKINTKLSDVARVKAADMRDKNYFSHTSPTYGSPFDMMKQFGITYRSAGENIAKGQKSPESVMNGWMNSQGHRENILNANYTEIGVGYVTDAKGNTYWVQMFIRP